MLGMDKDTFLFSIHLLIAHAIIFGIVALIIWGAK